MWSAPVALTVAGLIPFVLAKAKLPISTPGTTIALDKAYDVDFTTDANGGCKSYRHKIETAFVEAMAMIGEASDALLWLDRLTVTPEKSHGDEYNNFLRITQTYEKVFGANPWDSTIHDITEEAKDHFDIVYTYLNAHEIEEKEPTKWYLRCDDDWLKWREPNDADPRIPPQEETPPKWTLANPKDNTFKAMKTGAYEAPGLRPEDKLVGTRKGVWCTSVTAAITKAENKLIIFCPFLLDNIANKQYWSLDNVPVGTKATEQETNKMQGSMSIMAAAWVHELGHLLHDFKDPVAVDANGRQVQASSADNDPRGKVYGWELVTNYAKYRPEEVKKTADSYAMFALAMYWKDLYWASGVAKKVPETPGAATHPLTAPKPPSARMSRVKRLLGDQEGFEKHMRRIMSRHSPGKTGDCPADITVSPDDPQD